MNKKVSIIIPIYNVDAYLDKCIESAHKQSYKNIEIILVNDGSSDDCAKICDEWAIKDSRIRVIHKSNGGLSSARNAALDIAEGDYICFLDGDDYIEDNLLEKIVTYMDKGYDMVSFCYYALYTDGGIKEVSYKQFGEFKIHNEKERFNFLISTLVTGRIGWEACTRIFRREIIEKNKLRFADNKKVFAEDLYFTLCYCAHAHEVFSAKETLYYYRQRQDSIMGQESVRLNVGRMNELGKAVSLYYSEQPDCKYIVENFAAIHFVILSNVIWGYQKINNFSLKELRKQIVEDITDMEFFCSQFRAIRKHKKVLRSVYSSRSRFENYYNIIQYVLDGNYCAAIIRQNIYSKIAKIKSFARKKLLFCL